VAIPGVCVSCSQLAQTLTTPGRMVTLPSGRRATGATLSARASCLRPALVRRSWSSYPKIDHDRVRSQAPSPAHGDTFGGRATRPAELNGRTVRLLGWVDSQGRWRVQLDLLLARPGVWE